MTKTAARPSSISQMSFFPKKQKWVFCTYMHICARGHHMCRLAVSWKFWHFLMVTQSVSSGALESWVPFVREAFLSDSSLAWLPLIPRFLCIFGCHNISFSFLVNNCLSKCSLNEQVTLYFLKTFQITTKLLLLFAICHMYREIKIIWWM